MSRDENFDGIPSEVTSGIGTETWRVIQCSFCPFDGRKFPSTDDRRCKQCGAPRPEVLLPDNNLPLSGLAPVVVLPRHATFVLINQEGRIKPVFWRKILYEQQPFPDNFTDRDQFLSYLINDTKGREYSYQELVKNTAFLLHPVCLVTIYVCVWRLLRRTSPSASDLLLLCNCLTLFIGYLIWQMLTPHRGASPFGIHRAVVLFGCVKAICPILQTLTRTFSDDTVILLSTIMFALHLTVYDYTFVMREKGNWSGSLTINAAMFGAVLLASRLASGSDVFAFIFLGVIIFSLSSILRRSIYTWSVAWHHYGVTLVLLVTTLRLLFEACGGGIAQIFLVGVTAVCLGAPMLFINAQKYRSDLRGPWDLPDVRVYQ